MRNLAIISVDGHVRAPRHVYRSYLDSNFIDRFDDWVAARGPAGRDAGNIQPDLIDDVQWDAGDRLARLETQGVVAEVLFPNGVPFQTNPLDDAGRPDRPDESHAGKDSYNRWLSDFCAEAPDRFAGQAVLLFDDVDRAVRDVLWAHDHGLRGVMLPGLYPGDRYFFDPALDPIWAAIEETGLPISQHGGAGVPRYAPGGMAAILTLAYEQAFFSGRSLWQMIVGGVFDRFPALRLVFVETQVHWIGPALQQFDDRVRRGDDWTEFAAHLQRSRAFSRLPSEYWSSNCYAGISPFHPSQVPLENLGSDAARAESGFTLAGSRSMFGVDFPHFESIFPATRDQVRQLAAEPAVTADDLDRILFETAASVYGFERHRLEPHIERFGFSLD
jgi:predicted TIM-barrel fold metal-dependent hydrolase